MARDELAAIMRTTARWRHNVALRFADDRIARRRSYRAMVAIRIAANFVESLPEDDPDLAWLRHVDGAALCDEGRDILGRFGLDRGAWNQGAPGEAQIRRLLRRLAGAEARERAADRRDAC